MRGLRCAPVLAVLLLALPSASAAENEGIPAVVCVTTDESPKKCFDRGYNYCRQFLPDLLPPHWICWREEPPAAA